MSFLSKKQNAFAYTPRGLKAFGGPAKVKEWEAATNYKSLPERVARPKKRGLKNVRLA